MNRKLLACSILAAALSTSAAHAQTTLNGGGSSLAFPTYTAEFAAYTQAHPTIKFSYAAVGSGSGQTAFLTNNITLFSSPPAGTQTYGTIVGSQVDFGASDAFLIASQLTNPATGSYGTSTVGSAVDGPLIQVPTFGVPITLAYNEPGASSLTLSDTQLCGVLSGKITDWNLLDPSIPAGTTIDVVYFSNSSGTTFLTTQHLNAVCNLSNSSFPVLPVPITTHFVASTGGVFTSSNVPPNFIGANASSGVSTALLNTTNSIGYLSPDYTSIAPHSLNTTSLPVASLINSIDGKAYQPTVANTTLGLANPDPDNSTNAKPPGNPTAAMDPLNWIPTIAQTLKGYPIVGYSTLELSSCYADAAAGTSLEAFLKAEYSTASYKTIITTNGFVPLTNSAAAPYVKTVEAVFLSNNSKDGLNIDNEKLCAGYAGR
jgi:ABC-type phosphate transport system substrate-binding protein